MFKQSTAAIAASICLATGAAAISAEYIIGSDDFPESLDYMLDSALFSDPENFFERLQLDFKVDRQSREEQEAEDNVIMFGENFTVHTNADKKMVSTSPKVQGYQDLNCNINSSMAKICWGSLTDATAWVDFSSSLPKENQIAYTLQTVAEATTARAILFEFFGVIRSEVKFDLSLIKIRPLLFQIRKYDTSEMTWAESQEIDEPFCLGWYSDLKILPFYIKFITNIQKCAYSFIHFIAG